VALSVSGASVGLLARKGAAMAGISISSPFAAADSPAMLAYEHAMSVYDPQSTDPTTEPALGGYVAADEMIQGLRLAGPCPTRTAFIQNLRKITDFNGGGLIVPVNLGRSTAPDNCFTFVRVDATGHSFVPVPSPTATDQSGLWCGQPLP
jgi:hypothetical protein